ncbi:MAG: 1-deoxy-D-xylulose-5-phosphate reductoisomerase [Hyphomicrobiales bacterium]|nr:1-deoxy-D-xylulose-5-phosphate reductoisomerase [Hyphomicrobiales bacterium]
MSIKLRPEPEPAATLAPRRLVILGATGSIGKSTADVISEAPRAFTVEAVAGGRDGAALARMAIRLGARFAAVADAAAYAELKAGLSGHRIEAAAGAEAITQAALFPSDLVIAAISGAAGVEPTHAALEAGRTVALANKECLVCAGGPFMRTAARTGARLLPMDSEHNAIFQALGTSRVDEIEQMILTASGGPFRTWSSEAIARATPDQAVAHPNWSMGPKVSVDSATLMNKGLELIEAHHLFGVPAGRLHVLVHPQSIVHGLVSFADGAVVAGMACPDMKVPIAHCLGYPERVTTSARRLDLAEIGTLTFERPDLVRFPALRVAMAALQTGGALPTVLNAANEIAVEFFLGGRIGFLEIAEIVEACCEAAMKEGGSAEPATVADALAVDHMTRERARTLLA